MKIFNKNYWFWIGILIAVIGIFVFQVTYIKQAYEREKESFFSRTRQAISNFSHNAGVLTRTIIVLDEDDFIYTDYNDSPNQKLEIEVYSFSDILIDSARVLQRIEQLKILKEQLGLANTTKTSNEQEYKEYIEIDIEYACSSCFEPDIYSLNLDSLLLHELKKQKINETMTFGIHDPSTKQWKFLSNENIDEDRLLKSGIVQEFFNAPTGPETNTLKIFFLFDNAKLYLLKAIRNELLSSLFLLILLITSLYFTYIKSIKRQRLYNMKTDFVNNMTHELKTPVANILLGLDTLVNPKVIGNKKMIETYAKVLRKESHKINQIVDRVLESENLQEDYLTENLEIINVVVLVKDTLNQFKSQITNKNGNLKLHSIDDDKLTLLGNPVHLKNMISNIIDNAIKYSENPPVIEITVLQDHKNISIQIKDNGIGIPKSAIPYLFDRFYRIPKENLHDTKGYGLGLNYAQAVAKSLHGEIKVSSKIGVGSTFTIIVPNT